MRLVREDDSHRSGLNLLKAWAEYMAASGYSAATIKIRTQSVESLMRYSCVDAPLELTRNHVIAWLARPTKQWTRITYYLACRMFSRWLVEFGHDPGSTLVKGIAQPKKPDPVARPIDDTTIERLLALKLTNRSHLYVRLGLYQALRVHEIAKIRGEHFDLDSGWLMVNGKGAVTKPIPIHPEIAKLAERMPAIGYWFPSYAFPGEPIHPDAVSQTITAALKMAGSTATAHQLRDTAATRLQRTFKDIRVTQSMLRHRDISSTMKYTAASDDDMHTALRGLDWTDTARQEPPRPNALPDLATLTPEQLQQLAAQLTALAKP